MTIQEIRKICYEKYGSMSKLAESVLIQAINYNDIHKLCYQTGIGFKMVKEIVLIFGELNQNHYKLNEEVVKCLKSSDFEIELKETEEINSIINKFKFHNKNLDHVSATANTLFLRAKYIINNIDVTNCSILFLGDHDFTSVALAFYLNKLGYSYKNITVVDLDDNVLDFIYDCNVKYNLKINILHCDFRFGVPKCCEGKYDFIFTDPPYTPEGMGLFLKRALQCSINKFATICLCYKTAELSPGVGLKVQQELLRTHVYFRAIIPNFNSYIAAEALGYKSDLYICSLTSKSIEQSYQKTDTYEIYTHGRNSIEAISATNEKMQEILSWITCNLKYDKKNIKVVSNVCFNESYCISFGKYFYQRSNKTPNLAKRDVILFDFCNQADEVLDLRFLLMSDKCETFALFNSSQLKIIDAKKYNYINILYDITKYKIEDKVLVKFSLKDSIPNSINRIFLYTFASLKNAFVNTLTKFDPVSQNQAREKFYNMNLMALDDSYIFDLPCCILNILAEKLSNTI